MSYVDDRVKQLTEEGFFSASRVEPNAIAKIINMAEWDYYNLPIVTLESYLGLLAQQVYYIQQECNIAEAREIELGNSFKIAALPLVIDSKIRSVEERFIFASTLTDELGEMYKNWQNAIIEAKLKKDLAEPVKEKLNVFKKIYDDRRMEGKNRNIQKYVDGSGA